MRCLQNQIGVSQNVNFIIIMCSKSGVDIIIIITDSSRFTGNTSSY